MTKEKKEFDQFSRHKNLMFELPYSLTCPRRRLPGHLKKWLLEMDGHAFAYPRPTNYIAYRLDHLKEIQKLDKELVELHVELESLKKLEFSQH